MATALALVTSSVMLLIAALHVYWGHGGNWPGTDRQDLLDKVVGRGEAFPPLLACYAVAGALLFAGATPLLSVGLLSVPGLPPELYLSWLQYFIAAVFLLRGAGGYLPVFERKATPAFVRLNRRIYDPLCLFLALCFGSLASCALRGPLAW